MSFKRVSKACLDPVFAMSAGFPPEIAGPSDFVTRWNMTYEENDAMVAAQDEYYERWLAFQAKDQAERRGIKPITFTEPTYHQKGWGEEVWVASNDKYCGKILKFFKGKKMSKHSHDIKSESWLVMSGKLKMTWFDLSNADEKERILVPMDVVHIPRGNPHQLEAIEDSEVFEVSDADRSWDNYRIGKGASQNV